MEGEPRAIVQIFDGTTDINAMQKRDEEPQNTGRKWAINVSVANWDDQQRERERKKKTQR